MIILNRYEKCHNVDTFTSGQTPVNRILVPRGWHEIASPWGTQPTG